MAKKRNWLSLIKRLLFPETHHHHHHHHPPQKIKRRRWLFGKLLKRTKTLPSLSPPNPTNPQSIQIVEAEHHHEEEEEKQSNFEDDEVFKNNVQLPEIITNEAKLSSFNSNEHENHVETQAAIKIQTLYRGYLARKALRALKGFVRLQAIIRGRAVRRQAMTTLKCLQSIAKIQSQVCARRYQMIRGKDGDLQLQLHLQDPRIEHPKIQFSKQRRKDDELLTKEEQIDIILRKKEAILRSNRIKAYSFNHRHSADSEDGISEGRLRYWLEQYVSDEVSKKDEKIGGNQNRLRNIEGLNIFDITTVPRRSFHKHKKQNSCGEGDGLHSSSPINLPAYMAATESAKAKTRPLSSPRLRPLHIEAYSDGDSPYKHKLLSPMSSINSEAACSGISKVSNRSSLITSSQQKSPSFKGVSGPIRSNKNLK